MNYNLLHKKISFQAIELNPIIYDDVDEKLTKETFLIEERQFEYMIGGALEILNKINCKEKSEENNNEKPFTNLSDITDENLKNYYNLPKYSDQFEPGPFNFLHKFLFPKTHNVDRNNDNSSDQDTISQCSNMSYQYEDV